MRSHSSRDARREVVVQNPRRYKRLDVPGLRSWLEAVVEELAGGASSLAVRLVSDEEIRALNRSYRNRDLATDVLSFPGDETFEGRHLGDVVVSVPRARKQAETAGLTIERELKELILHGVLHCLGHDHEMDGGEMQELELELRRKWIEDAV